MNNPLQQKFSAFNALYLSFFLQLLKYVLKHAPIIFASAIKNGKPEAT